MPQEPDMVVKSRITPILAAGPKHIREGESAREYRQSRALERRSADRRQRRFAPRRGREEAPVVAGRRDELQSQRQPAWAEAARDYDRRGAHERPPRAEARVAGRLGGRRLADRG